MPLANERRHYIVTSSLIGTKHSQNDPCWYRQLHSYTSQYLSYDSEWYHYQFSRRKDFCWNMVNFIYVYWVLFWCQVYFVLDGNIAVQHCCEASDLGRIKSQILCYLPRLAQSIDMIEARCWVENEDVVGAAPTGAAPTTSEWSTILLPTKVWLTLEVWRYFGLWFQYRPFYANIIGRVRLKYV